ncbi:MAG: AAA family ATPase [Deltaproteobacteria bacterium]|jgi:hypothetical protein|nr:AAA family ATPase [Deltaproteobacteria bacterium]
MKNLSLFDIPFEQLISEDRLYVDKTGYISLMVNEFKGCFLSRPRRFGKTLLLDTIHSLFLGREDLFRGLAIESSGWEFKKHPVIRINMDYEKLSSASKFKINVGRELKRVAEAEGIKLKTDLITEIWERLLSSLSKKYGLGVVVLIDDFDSPVVKNLGEPNLAKEMAKIINELFSSIKNYMEYIRFAFVTGVSKFILPPLDTENNQFIDITLDPRFAGICGFTITEFDEAFKDRMFEANKVLKAKNQIGRKTDELAFRQRIIKMYAGYDWLGPETILNPHSTLNLFQQKSFGSFWPLIGMAPCLAELVKNAPFDFLRPKLDGYIGENIEQTSILTPQVGPVLFHSGYLTINNVTRVMEKDGDIEKEIDYYAFKIPNAEITLIYDIFCLREIFEENLEFIKEKQDEVISAIENRHSAFLARFLGTLLSGLPPRPKVKQDRYYRSLIMSAMVAMGAEPKSRVIGTTGPEGEILVLPSKERLIIEVKYVKPDKNDENADKAVKLDVAFNAALTEIVAKEASESFIQLGEFVIGLGVAVYGWLRGRVGVKVGFLK